MIRALLAILMISSPLAAASGRLDVGPATIVVDNGHESDCVEEVTNLCLASVSGETIGELEIEGTEHFSRVGVAVDADWINERVGLELLPGGELLAIDIDDFDLPNPVSPYFAEHGGGFYGPSVLSPFGLVFNHTTYGVAYYGPHPNDPTGPSGPHAFAPGYQGVIQYDHIEMPRGAKLLDSDYEAHSLLLTPCFVFDTPGCKENANATFEDYTSLAPGITLGVGFLNATVAGDPDALVPEAGLARESPPAEPMTFRSTAQPPDASLLRDSPRAGPLSSGSPSGPLPAFESPPRSRPSEVESPLRAQGAHPETRPGGPPTALIVASTLAIVVLFAALYARITRRGDALASPQRASIVHQLKENGPMRIHDLATTLGVHRTTIFHHALVLRRLHEVTILRRGSHAILALPDQATATLPAPRPRGTLLLVLEALSTAGGTLTRSDLHARLQAVPLRTRNHAIRELTARGLVIERDDELALRTPA